MRGKRPRWDFAESNTFKVAKITATQVSVIVISNI